VALRGSQAAVLRATDESPKDAAGYVSDEQISGLTQIAIDDVRDWLTTLQDDGLVSLSRTVDGFRAAIEARGRIELREHQVRLKDRRGSPAAVIEKERSKIRPKGLRSFDKEDADFFLELLPGPYDHDGLPDGISFWKIRIEGKDADRNFRVGAIYGPSGCGKSSLMKAGLLPRLADNILVVYVEATATDTESRLLKGIRQRCPDLTPELDLHDSLSCLRRSRSLPSGKRLLLVIDQFEQWFLARRRGEDTELVHALGHCDQVQVQAIVMVRDDFLSASIQFMEELDVEFRPSLNARRVDLFGRPHAKKVLAAFGQSYGVLGADLTPDQQAFLNQAVDGLARERIVMPVHLALFAEMLKGREWTPKKLKEIGGTEGVGVAFLEETFSSSYADPRHRTHQEAARSVLKALLAESGNDLKGPKRSSGELLEASGYTAHPARFEDLIRILDSELRLITPTASEDSTSEDQSALPHGEPYFQLTHDYLVHSLREWLTRKQKETHQGRAQLRLAERAALWSDKPEDRLLPSAWDWVRIRMLTRKQSWTQPQRNMMRKAARHHGIRGLTLAILLVLAGWAGYESYASLEASALVESVLTAETADMPRLIERLAGYRRWANPLLVQSARDSTVDSKEHLHCSLALLAGDPGQIEYLYHRLLKLKAASIPIEFKVIRDELKRHRGSLVGALWGLLEDPQADAEHRFLAACALADYDASAAERRWDAVSRFITDRLLTSVIKNPTLYSSLIDFLRPVRHRLISPLSSTFRDKHRSDSERYFATIILADYLEDRAEDLADLLMDADAQRFSILLPKAKGQGETMLALLESELGRTATPHWNDPPLDPSWIKPDTTLVTKIEAAEGLLTDRFAFCQTMPLDGFEEVAEGLRASAYRPIRFRPYADGRSVRVAAVWTRDGRKWKLGSSLSAKEIQAKDAELRHGKLLPVDVAGYVATRPDGTRIERYAALWAEPADPEDDARMYVAVAENDHSAVQEPLRKDGFIPSTLQAVLGEDGRTRYCSVWEEDENWPNWQMSWNQTEPLYERNSMRQSDKVTFDVSVSQAAKPISTKERSTQELQAAEAALKSKPNQPDTRFARALANLRLGNEQKAIEDFTFLIQAAPQNPEFYRFRAIAHARLQERREAMDDLAAFQKRSGSDAMKHAIAVIISAHSGEEGQAIRGLEALLEKQPNDQMSHYYGACAYSQASQAVASKDVTKGKVYADRAVALLHSAIRNGYSEYQDIQTNPAFDPIRGQPGFQEILEAGKLDRSYAAVWRPASTWASVESHGFDPGEHRRRCREWLSQGYRPVALSVARTAADRLPVATSVWHRPVVSEDAKESLARRQAHAALALARLGRPEKLWPLLIHSPDPSVRSYIVNLLNPLGVDPKVVLAALESLDRDKSPTAPQGQSRMEAILFHPETSMRRALILALGHYGTEWLTPDDREPLMKKLLSLYETDPDAGIHGATEWTLRRWGREVDLKQADSKLRAKGRGDRGWYVNSQGQTLAVIEGPVEFSMGSPPTEPDRYEFETLHRERINRRFAIATKEVTVMQYERFVRASQENQSHRIPDYKSYSPDPRGPQVGASWYNAAAYCNWLSRQEGLAACYEPNRAGEYAEGMRIVADFLNRPGYRLPTEAEWEYACRAGAVTSRYYGRSVELLKEYAWYFQNAAEHARPCGRLMPNDLGLFDLLGNAYEWCQEVALFELKIGASNEISLLVNSTFPRLVRGGSYTVLPAYFRSAYRWRAQPSDRFLIYGFRPVRTNE
jgi:formylglycine-generating enzyme required for sulfatase activity/tetratricopeptide (TPR) repeat protein